MSYLEILRYAEQEANRVENHSFRVKGAVRQRELGSMDYVNRIGAFLFWMRYGKRPAGASEDDFQLYRIIAERLVAKGQFKATILDDFNDRGK
jgi:hypothetical protein